MRRFRTLLSASLAAFMLLAAGGPTNAAGEKALWDALKQPGHIAFIRHALAPGGGDPPGFTIGDCSTQRNLSDEGRRQAARTGDAFRENGIERADVYSSQWCRCRETAEQLGLGEITQLPALNSLYGRKEREAEQIKALRQTIASLDLSGPVVMVSHHATIMALTGVSTSSGEIAVVKREGGGGLSVIGKIGPKA